VQLNRVITSGKTVTVDTGGWIVFGSTGVPGGLYEDLDYGEHGTSRWFALRPESGGAAPIVELTSTAGGTVTVTNASTGSDRSGPVPNAIFTKAREAFANGQVNWVGDTIKAVVVDLDDVTINPATMQFLSQITPSTARIATATLSGKTATNGVLDAADNRVPRGLGRPTRGARHLQGHRYRVDLAAPHLLRHHCCRGGDHPHPQRGRHHRRVERRRHRDPLRSSPVRAIHRE
jgi:hypothetical protein